MEQNFKEITKTYKRKVAGTFMLVEGAKLTEKISGEEFVVTKKLDGAMHGIFLRDGKVSAVSTGGEERTGLPCLDEFAELAKKAGLTSATVIGELYAKLDEAKRERVYDLNQALADDKLKGKIHLAPFDILDLDGETWQSDNYGDTLKKLDALLCGTLVKPVEGKTASSKDEVKQIFDGWVTNGGAEGIVVHSEQSIIYKVKPRHTIDTVITGFTVGEGDTFRDIMAGMMTSDGLFQMVGITGNGFTDEQRSNLYARLNAMTVPSEFIETDSRNVAFQMVRPEIVVELSAVDFISENAAGEAKMNALLRYDEEQGYISEGQVPGVSTLSLVFVRERDDKTVCPSDIRISQVSDICPFSEGKGKRLSGLPKSELLARRIFQKGKLPKLMIQKYVVWKTNKEDSGAFPAYVFHYTDYSSGRKDYLKRDIRVSSNREQIMKFMDDFIAANVKKGWEEVK